MPSGCLHSVTQSLSHSVTFHLHFLVTSPSHSVNSTPSAYLSRFEVKTSTSVSCMVIQTNQREFLWITTTLQYRTSHGHKQRMRGKTMAHETLPSLSLSQFTIATFPLALSCVKVRQHDTILQYIANIKFKK